MTKPLSPALPRWIRNFLRDTRGNITVEFILIMPFLFWAFMATYVFFDGYRQSTINLKAAYTISDMISRETNAINDTYIDSMRNLMTVLTRANSPVTLRVSVVRWDEEDSRYYLDWSTARGVGIQPLTDPDMGGIASKLPVMPDNERVILVETSNTFESVFPAVMDNVSLDNFVFTRPRFAPQVVWES